MQKYEVFTIFPGTLAENEVQPVVQRVVSLIQDAGVTKVEPQALGKMKIAYPMKQVRYGYFYNFLFDAEPSAIPALSQKLRIEENLLRSIVRMFDPATRVKPPARRKAPAAELEEAAKAPVAATPIMTEVRARGEQALNMEELGKKVDELLEEDFKLNV